MIVGFLGVLIVTNPGTETFTIGALFALGNAVMYGTRDRRRARPDLDRIDRDADALPDAGHVGGVLADAAVRLRGADLDRLPAGSSFNGVGNGSAQYWWTRAIHLAPTSAVAPFQYFSLIWAMMLGFAIWGDVPTVSLLIGAAIVAGSGLFLLWREARRRCLTCDRRCTARPQRPRVRSRNVYSAARQSRPTLEAPLAESGRIFSTNAGTPARTDFDMLALGSRLGTPARA